MIISIIIKSLFRKHILADKWILHEINLKKKSLILNESSTNADKPKLTCDFIP